MTKDESFIINETMSLLGVKALQDISPAIKNKDRTCKKLNRFEKFSTKVQMLIQQVSPPDKFEGQKPSLKATWNWVTKLFEQYMKLKQSSRQERQVRKVFKQLMSAVGLSYPKDVELLKEKLNKLNK